LFKITDVVKTCVLSNCCNVKSVRAVVQKHTGENRFWSPVFI